MLKMYSLQKCLVNKEATFKRIKFWFVNNTCKCGGKKEIITGKVINARSQLYLNIDSVLVYGPCSLPTKGTISHCSFHPRKELVHCQDKQEVNNLLSLSEKSVSACTGKPCAHLTCIWAFVKLQFIY